MTTWNTKSEYYKALKGKSQCCETLSDVELTEWERFRYYRMLGTGQFEWVIPEEYPILYLNAARIEQELYDDGKMLIWEREGELVISRCIVYGFNGYMEPDKYKPIWFNGINYIELDMTLDETNAVLIRNNEDMIPTRNLIAHWVKRYAEVQTCMDNNLQYANYPLMIDVDQGKDVEAELTQSIFRTFRSMIIKRKNSDPFKGVEPINFNIPYIIDKLRLERDAYDADILQIIGDNNVNTLKRERLITAEADANNEETMQIMGSKLELRKRACKKAKKLFGVDIDCIKRGVMDNANDGVLPSKSGVYTNIQGTEGTDGRRPPGSSTGLGR